MRKLRDLILKKTIEEEVTKKVKSALRKLDILSINRIQKS